MWAGLGLEDGNSLGRISQLSRKEWATMPDIPIPSWECGSRKL